MKNVRSVKTDSRQIIQVADVRSAFRRPKPSKAARALLYLLPDRDSKGGCCRYR